MSTTETTLNPHELEDLVKADLNLNDLLLMAGISPSDVKVYRHSSGCDSYKKFGVQSMYDFWKQSLEEFEKYQAQQGIRDTFSRRYVAAFMKTPDNKTVFIGFYEKLDVQKNESNGHDYTLQRTDILSGLIDRLIIDWNFKSQSPSATAENNLFEVLQLTAESYQREFPGYQEFVCDINHIDNYPATWHDILRAAKGVYLLTCKDTGSRYVGSATGEQGFYGRWLGYKNGNHNNNKFMKPHATTGYYATILQVLYNASSDEEFEKIEHSWIRKLKTSDPICGLNNPYTKDDESK